MTNFLDTATAWIDQQSNAATRRVALSAVIDNDLPTTTDEVWRYAPLEYFNLDSYDLASPSVATAPDALEQAIAALGALVVRTTNGVVASIDGALDGVSVTTLSDAPSFDGDTADTFAVLNAAITPGTLAISVDAGVNVTGTVVLLHTVTEGASFPHVQISLGRSAALRVVEVWSGGTNALVVPVSQYHVDENASLSLATYQRLDLSAWYISRTTTTLSRDARMHQSVIGMGGAYDRARNDAILEGANAQNELWTTYLGRGKQVHDLRSHQLHRSDVRHRSPDLQHRHLQHLVSERAEPV